MTRPDWIDVSTELPESHDVVIIFQAPRRALAQYCPFRKQPWSLMDGTYLDREQVVIWSPLPEHPYGDPKV